MKSISRVLFIVIAIVTLSWFLPWLYNLVFPDTTRVPFAQFSPVNNRWIVSQVMKNGSDPVIFDVDKSGNIGNYYTVEQRDSLLPQTYYSRLMSKGQMPDSVAGLEMTMPFLRHNELVMSVSPRNFVLAEPEIWLIMESMPKRFNFEDPAEAFRFTNDGKVEFVVIDDNTINRERSRRFSDAFARSGFKFPPRHVNGNVTTRKAYDNGYLLVDSAGDIFHMKQQAGRPYLSRIAMPDGEVASKAFVMEYMNRSDLGLLLAESGHVFRLLSDYTLQQVPGLIFDQKCQKLMLAANCFNRVYRISDDHGVSWYAVDASGERLLDKYHYEYPTQVSAEIAGWIFPFELNLVSAYDSLARVRIVDYSVKAFVFGAVLALVICLVYYRRQYSLCSTCCATLITLVLGVYAFIPLLLIHK